MTMTNQTPESMIAEARVEAAAQAVREVDARAGLIADVDLPMYRARAALAAADAVAECQCYGADGVTEPKCPACAADAVVTVEMIAVALHGDECPEDPDEGELCGCDGNHYMRQGGIVLALLRGGEDRE